ncbi:hypothetical protein L3Y34_015157 [Caenorhabditis briggsae]|uniref:Protein N-terminal glutamine amidohydrolase n=1 Tax=Caenorhabditis briggsae TaxID=6238 RepID=A0AAE9IYK2_CAEBR|nr:hypothetical protein L3Y34_015157 [Caenorhabditis briggsae]
MLSAEEAPYQSCYCEENVYKLLEKLKPNLDDFFAVLISNDIKMIPLWKQKAERDPESFVLWDYHVITISKNSDGSAKVYDFDSWIDWGVDFQTYWNQTMNEDEMKQFREKYRRKFRIIPARIYLSLLSSDRSHMLNPDGTYMKPPPEWPLIQNSTNSNLMNLIDMKLEFPETMVMDETEIRRFFSDA